MYMHHMCAWCPQRAEEDDRGSELESDVVVSLGTELTREDARIV